MPGVINYIYPLIIELGKQITVFYLFHFFFLVQKQYIYYGIWENFLNHHNYTSSLKDFS